MVREAPTLGLTLVLMGDRRTPRGLFSAGAFILEESCFMLGDFARLADSRNQCFNVAR